MWLVVYFLGAGLLWLIEWLEWRLFRGYRDGPQNQ
jgi:hypothetical protein